MQSCCTQNPQTPPVQNSKSCKVPRGAELAWFPSSLQCFRIQQGRSSGSQKLPRAGGVGGEGPGTWWGLDQKDRGGGGLLRGGHLVSSALNLAAGRIAPAAAVERLLAAVEWTVLERVGLAPGGPTQGTNIMPQDRAHHHALWGLQLV